MEDYAGILVRGGVSDPFLVSWPAGITAKGAVLGVDPSAQGLGLGPALTVAGLRYLAGQGLPAVILYVDESNAGAVRLYTRLGFTESNVDVQYQRSRA